MGSVLAEALATVPAQADCTIEVAIWQSPASGTAQELPQADLHAVFIDAAPWMPEAFITALFEAKECPIRRLVLVGFRPERGGGAVEALRDVPRLPLFFEAFPEPECIQLPLSAGELAGKLHDALKRPDQGAAWQANWTRVAVGLDAVREKDSRTELWRRLDSLCGEDRVLQEEHEAAASTDRRERFQQVSDVFHLVRARSPDGNPRQVLVLDDNLSPMEERLKVLARASGTKFYVTRNGDACMALADGLWQSKRAGVRPELSDLVLIDGNGRKDDVAARWNELDLVLVDLLLLLSGSSRANGEEIVASLHDHYPELPVFVVTQSEEPDVLARCLRLRGADRVVPKRRLLRLSFEIEDYFNSDVSPLLPVLRNASCPGKTRLDRELVRLYRIWHHEPEILWLGEKSFHGPEHSVEHHRGLWTLANQVLSTTWGTVSAKWSNGAGAGKPGSPCVEEMLFCFFLAIWLHDIGARGNDQWQSADEVRDRHAFITGCLLDDPEYRSALGLDGTDDELLRIVADLCRYHQSNCPLIREDLTRINDSNSQEATKDLFTQALEERTPWALPWLALLRLLDAVEHGWKRSGSELLYRCRLRLVDHERAYYDNQLRQVAAGRCGSERRTENALRIADLGRYAAYLDRQQGVLDKHRAILGAWVHLEAGPEGWNLYPCYRIDTNSDGAEGIARNLHSYVLKEWASTGRFLREIGLFIPRTPPTTGPAESDGYTWVYDTQS
jgi:CheY-like chemotaxis protein